MPRPISVELIALIGVLGILQPAYSAGFPDSLELAGTTLPAGVSIVEITIDGREPRYPETFIDDLDGDGKPEFVAFPGGFAAGQCRPLLIALSTVRSANNIDSTDTRYITIPDANAAVPADSYCTDIETFETIGDMNGDGFAEFALYSQGTYVLQGLQNRSGEISLIDIDGSNGFVVQNALLRRNVGDLDGDGLDELALTHFGDQYFDFGPEYILRGRAGTRTGVILPETDTNDELLATIYNGSQNYGLILPLGDVNGDAIDDLLIQQSDHLNIIYGEVGLTISSDVPADPSTPSIGENCGFFSCPTLSGFDFDADGYNDIAITLGAGSNRSSAIIYGGPDGLPEGNVLADFDSSQITLITGNPGLSSGFTDTFGDINGDGADDVYFSSGRGTILLFATPGRRVAEINIDSLDGSNGFRLEIDQTQVSSTFRPFINGRVLMADLNDDGIDDYLDGQTLVEGINDAPIGDAPLGILVRQGPESADFFWHLLDESQEVAGYRVSIDENVLAELPSTASQYRVEFNSRTQSQDVRISSIDSAGNVIGASVRRIQAFGEGFGMRAEVYGPNLIEIIWDAPADDYLVWRDGEVYQLVNGHSFLDTDIEPGVDHEYFVMATDLKGGAESASYLNSLEGLQRRTTAVSIGPQDTSEPANPEEPVDPVIPEEPVTPVNPVDNDQRPDIPTNLSGTVYSTTSLEIFWSRVTNTVIGRYDVYRNGAFAGSAQGPSWYEANLDPANVYRYSIVAVSTAGKGSVASTTLKLDPGNNGTTNANINGNTNNEYPVTPTGLHGTVYSSSALELFWDRGTAQSQSYIVKANGVEVGSSAGTSLFISDLNAGVEYQFTVLAADPDTAAQTTAASVKLSTLN